jgi:hypothetical protein
MLSSRLVGQVRVQRFEVQPQLDQRSELAGWSAQFAARKASAGNPPCLGRSESGRRGENHRANGGIQEMEEQQAITTFQQAAEQMRSLRDHEWLITFYAVTAYAALASAPKLLEQYRVWWRIIVSSVAIVLVVLVAAQAWRTLWYSNAVVLSERARLQEAITNLPLIEQIYRNHPPLERSERPWLVRTVQWFFARLLGRDELPPGRWGLVLGVGLGALFANQFLVSQLVVSWKRGQAFGLGFFCRTRKFWLWLVVIGLEVGVLGLLLWAFRATFAQAGDLTPLPHLPMPDPLL